MLSMGGFRLGRLACVHKLPWGYIHIVAQVPRFNLQQSFELLAEKVQPLDRSLVSQFPKMMLTPFLSAGEGRALARTPRTHQFISGRGAELLSATRVFAPVEVLICQRALAVATISRAGCHGAMLAGHRMDVARRSRLEPIDHYWQPVVSDWRVGFASFCPASRIGWRNDREVIGAITANDCLSGRTIRRKKTKSNMKNLHPNKAMSHAQIQL